jgi:Glycosyl transferase family 2
MTGHVAVIIPTLRRPDGLRDALRSVFAQRSVGDRVAQVVVVDNDPTGSARDLVGRLQAETPWPLTYVHAPVPGVATARNAGLAATQAPLIAFLDDDEVASPGWLAALLEGQTQTGADVVFGPITGRAPSAEPWLQPYLERFFGRHGPATTQAIDQPWGCGNSLMVRATALPGPAPFNTASDQAGGEVRLGRRRLGRGVRTAAPRHPALCPGPRLRLWPGAEPDGRGGAELAGCGALDADRRGAGRGVGGGLGRTYAHSQPQARRYL